MKYRNANISYVHCKKSCESTIAYVILLTSCRSFPFRSCQTSVSTCDAYTQTPPQSNNTTRTSSSSNSDRRRGRGETKGADKSSCDRHKERYSTDRERRKRLHSTSPSRVKKDLHRKRLDDLNNKVKKRRTSSIENKKPSKRQKTAKTTKITTNRNHQNITNTNDIEEGEIVSSDDN